MYSFITINLRSNWILFNSSWQSYYNFRKKGYDFSLLEISYQLLKFIWNFRRVVVVVKIEKKIIEISFDLGLECICFGLVGSHLPIVNKIECFIKILFSVRRPKWEHLLNEIPTLDTNSTKIQKYCLDFKLFDYILIFLLYLYDNMI